MKWFFSVMLAAMCALSLGGRVGAADDKDCRAVLDKAIKALGGEENLSKVKAAHWKTKGKITFNGEDHEFTGKTTMQGMEYYRSEFEGEFGGNKIKGVTVLAKNKGWRQFGSETMELDENALVNEKRNVYLQVLPMTLLPLKHKNFKLETAGEKAVDGMPAVGLKITPPDGKDFTMYFDKESGLPVQLAAKVVGFMGDEFTQEITFAEYKEFAGIKKATKVSSKRDGEKFIEAQIIEFKVLDKVDPKTFEEPK
jgi:hypothetical protein